MRLPKAHPLQQPPAPSFSTGLIPQGQQEHTDSGALLYRDQKCCVFRPSRAVFPSLSSLSPSFSYALPHTRTFTATFIWFVSSTLISLYICLFLCLSVFFSPSFLPPTLYTYHVVLAEMFIIMTVCLRGVALLLLRILVP